MKEFTRYQKEGPASLSARAFQVLSLSGGGYRGLFTACILENLEQRAGRPLCEVFDLIAGTSIGGILACGLAVGIEAEKMRKAFERLGPGIFESRKRVLGFDIPWLKPKGILSARYSQAGLARAIDEVLGDYASRTLSTVSTPLLVPAVSSTDAAAVFFESGRLAGSMASVTLRDVALATSAAPTYFPEHSIGKSSYIDGGLIANAPDAAAIIKAMSTFGKHHSELRLLSVGTAAEAMGEVYRPGRASGILGWMVTRNLFGLTIASQQSLSVDLVRELLNSRNIRIDLAPDRYRAEATGLDKAGPDATVTLSQLAVRAMDESVRRNGSELAAMLRHLAAR